MSTIQKGTAQGPRWPIPWDRVHHHAAASGITVSQIVCGERCCCIIVTYRLDLALPSTWRLSLGCSNEGLGWSQAPKQSKLTVKTLACVMTQSVCTIRWPCFPNAATADVNELLPVARTRGRLKEKNKACVHRPGKTFAGLKQQSARIHDICYSHQAPYVYIACLEAVVVVALHQQKHVHTCAGVSGQRRGYVFSVCLAKTGRPRVAHDV
jgi:hypothetical protein